MHKLMYLRCSKQRDGLHVTWQVKKLQFWNKLFWSHPTFAINPVMQFTRVHVLIHVHLQTIEKVYWTAITPLCVSVINQHPTSASTDNKITFFHFFYPTAAGLHHLQVYKLKNICSACRRESGLEFTWIVNVHSTYIPENPLECIWIVLWLPWKVKMPKAWRKKDLIPFQKVLIFTGKTYSVMFYLIIHFKIKKTMSL